MDVWGFLRPNPTPNPPEPKRKKGGRPTKQQAAERNRQRLADAKVELELADYDRRLKEMQTGNRPAAIDTDTIMAVVRYLKSLGLELRYVKGSGSLDDDRLMGLVKAFAPVIGEAVGGIVVRNLSPQQQAAIQGQAQETGATNVSAWRESPAGGGVPALEARSALQLPAPPIQQQSQEGEMSFVLRLLDQQLRGKDAAARAQWLLQVQIGEVQQLLGYLCQMPDDQLRTYLQQVATSNPDYRWVADWVLGQTDDWIVETVAELRRQTSTGPTVAGSGAS